MIALHPASLDELRDNWQFFVTGIGEVIDKCGLDFHPADVYREVTSGNGPVLFWIEDEEDTLGIIVANMHVEPYSRRRIFSVDMLYLLPHLDVAQGVRDAIDELATEHECYRIEWTSPREGWSRVMKQIGYEAGCCRFYREVKDGRE